MKKKSTSTKESKSTYCPDDLRIRTCLRGIRGIKNGNNVAANQRNLVRLR